MSTQRPLRTINAPTNLRIASIEGGGARIFSQLEILDNIMRRVCNERFPNDPDKVLLPCEHFNFIGGSDAGGLIAAMFVRLRMSVDEAGEEFVKIVDAVYAKGLEPELRTSRLRNCMISLLESRGFPRDLPLVDNMEDVKCVGFLLTAYRVNVATKICLKTYPESHQIAVPITLVDAVLATCASQPEFEPASVGVGHKMREYVGAGLAESNPVHQVISEAQSYFGRNAKVASLLSLGSGFPGVIHFRGDGDKLALNTVTRELMLDCERRAEEVERDIGLSGVYYRFSVDRGMNRSEIEDAQFLSSWISTQTEVYLSERKTEQKMEEFINKTLYSEGVAFNELGSTDMRTLSSTEDPRRRSTIQSVTPYENLLDAPHAGRHLLTQPYRQNTLPTTLGQHSRLTSPPASWAQRPHPNSPPMTWSRSSRQSSLFATIEPTSYFEEEID